MKAFQSAVDDGAIIASRIDDSKMLRSQKRALVFKFNCAKAKQEMFEKWARSSTWTFPANADGTTALLSDSAGAT